MRKGPMSAVADIPARIYITWDRSGYTKATAAAVTRLSIAAIT